MILCAFVKQRSSSTLASWNHGKIHKYSFAVPFWLRRLPSWLAFHLRGNLMVHLNNWIKMTKNGDAQCKFSFCGEWLRKAVRTFTEKENCCRAKLIYLVFSLSRNILHVVFLFCFVLGKRKRNIIFNKILLLKTRKVSWFLKENWEIYFKCLSH